MMVMTNLWQPGLLGMQLGMQLLPPTTRSPATYAGLLPAMGPSLTMGELAEIVDVVARADGREPSRDVGPSGTDDLGMMLVDDEGAQNGPSMIM